LLLEGYSWLGCVDFRTAYLRRSIGGRRSGEIGRTGILDASLEGLEPVFYASYHLTIVSCTKRNKNLPFSEGFNLGDK
jgi:hypothetical protein